MSAQSSLEKSVFHNLNKLSEKGISCEESEKLAESIRQKQRTIVEVFDAIHKWVEKVYGKKEGASKEEAGVIGWVSTEFNLDFRAVA